MQKLLNVLFEYSKTDDNRGSVNVSLSQLKTRKLNESMPSVSWITVPPEISERTSIKSVADYLSEHSQEELPTSKHNLCVSPETYDALEKADKLVESAKVQISQMNCDTLMIGDLKSDTTKNDKENLYIRNVVSSTIQKGFYDAEFSSRFNNDHFKPKLITKPCTQSQILNETYKRSMCQQKWSSPICRNLDSKLNRVQTESCIEPVNVLRTSDKCQDSAKETLGNIGKTSHMKENTEENKAEVDKPEKLIVQKGPVINIQGDLFVQTSKILDIQPDESIMPLFDEQFKNVATYECWHKSYEKQEISNIELVEPTTVKDKSQKDVGNETSTIFQKLNETYRKMEKVTSRDEPRRILMLDKQTSPDLKKLYIEPEIKYSLVLDVEDSTDTSDDIDIDFKDLSLQEPQILTDIDSLLVHQQKLMRQVYNTTKKFDRFLTKRLPDKHLSKCLKNIEKKKQTNYFSKEKSITENEQANMNTDLNTINDNKIIQNCYKRNVAVAEKQTIEVSAINTEASIVNKLNYSNESLLKIKHFSDTCEAERLSEEIEILSDAKSTKSNGESFRDKSGRVILELPENCESTISTIDESHASDTSNCQSANSGSRSNEVEKEFSLNSVSYEYTNINTKTRSNAGYIENLNIVRPTKENNFDTVSCPKESATKEILKSFVSGNCTGNTSQMDETLNYVEEIPKVCNDESTSIAPNTDSTESRIESKLSEARGSLDTLLRTMNVNDSRTNISSNEEVSSRTSFNAFEKFPENENFVENQYCHDEQKMNLESIANILQTSQEQIYNSRSVISMLDMNSSTMLEKSPQKKQSLLKKLESCLIPYRYEGTPLFTSTVLGDTEPSNSFTKLKGPSESSSEAHSEGEIILCSSASYSQGEIRRNTQHSKTSANTIQLKSNYTTMVSSYSPGELRKTERNS